MSSSFNGIDRPMASFYDLKSGKFYLVIYQSVTIHCHPSMVHAVGLKALHFLAMQNNRSFLKTKRKGKTLGSIFQLIDQMSNGSIAIIQNCQVIKSNKTYTLKESP